MVALLAGVAVGEPRHRDGQAAEQDARDDVRRVVEVERRLDLRRADRVDDAEDRDQAGVLLQRDQVVHQGRDHPAPRLRQHDVAQRLAVGQPERAAGQPLAGVHRLDAGAEHLGDVRRVGQHQRRAAPEQRRGRQPLEASAGPPKPSRKITSSSGRPRNTSTYAVPSRRSGNATGPRRVRTIATVRLSDEDQHPADRHHPDVEPEPLEHRGERRDRLVPVEVGLLDPLPARRADDRAADGAEQQQRAAGGDDGAAQRATPAPLVALALDRRTAASRACPQWPPGPPGRASGQLGSALLGQPLLADLVEGAVLAQGVDGAGDAVGQRAVLGRARRRTARARRPGAGSWPTITPSSSWTAVMK